jgi:phosphoglycerol transferase MdoB-like AlkP superfamily enzyme
MILLIFYIKYNYIIFLKKYSIFIIIFKGAIILLYRNTHTPVNSNYKSIINTVKNLFFKNLFFIYALTSILIKSFFFVGIIATEKATNININTVLYTNFPTLIYISFILIFISFSFLFKGKGQVLYLSIINFIFNLLVISDLWFFRGFNSFITAHSLNQTTNLENLLEDVLSMSRPLDLIFVAETILMIFIALKVKKLYSGKAKNLILFACISVTSVLYISLVHYQLDIVQEGKNGSLFKISWSPNETITNLSPIGYHVYDVYDYWSESRPYRLSTDEKYEIQKWFDNKKENLPDNSYKGIFKGKNLIIVQIESLENFVINQKIEDQEITPNINKLLANSLYFSNYHEQVHLGTSSDADFLTNTSVYPVRRGSTFFRYPSNTYNSLPKLLEEEGYATTAIHPDRGSYWNWMPALKSIGFKYAIDSASFNIDETIGLGLSDGSYLKQLEPMIVSQKNPFYTFFVTLTSHGPFDLPKEYRELKLNEDLDKTKMGGYFQSIHYVDKHLGLLLDKLQNKGILDNTVVAIYGDHTGVHKYYDDEVNKMIKKESWWSDNNWRIPLVIYSKDLRGEDIKTIGGQIDLLPTLAYTLGITKEKYENTALGRNLLNTRKSFAVLSDGKFLGEKSSDLEEEEAIKGLEIADKLIRSNYFSK